MNRRLMTFFVIAALVCATGVPRLRARQAVDLEAVVAQHYPPLLVQRSLDIDGFNPPRNQCFAVLQSSPTGTPQVVLAAYTNMVRGAVRLLQNTATGFEVMAEPAGYFTGWECDVETLDLNNDGRKEGVVHFLTGNSSVDWLFDWDGQQLRNLSPTETDGLGVVRTTLVNSSFVDIDGDRVMEAFTSSEPPQDGPPHPGELYRLSGSSFVLDRHIISMRTFERASGPPKTEKGTIILPAGAVGPYTLRIFNGGGTAVLGQRVENAVESGRIWWNGQQIVSPNNFGNQVRLIERTVTMQTENQLQVRLAGSPGGRIVIVVDASSWTP